MLHKPQVSLRIPGIDYFVILCCLAVTGFAGLAAQICWINKSALMFGSTVYAMSAVVAVFFAGLAFGNFLFGTKSRTVSRPLLWYGYCELAAGILVAMSPFFFSLINRFYAGLYPAAAHSPAMLITLKIFLVSLVILPPTLCMGGSLPMVNRHFIRTNAQITSSISLLYAINTLGATCGAFTCGLVLIPGLGFQLTLILAGAANIVAACAVLSIAYLRKPAKAEDFTRENESKIQTASGSRPVPRYAWLVMGILFFLSGCAAMGNELIWTRYLGLIIHNTVYTYTITLGVILLGITCGSLLVRFFSASLGTRALPVYAFVNLACGLSIAWLLWISPQFWNRVIDSENTHTIVWIAAILMLGPSLVSGISFPLGLRVIIRHYRNASRTIGSITAINIIGSITGSLLIGFIALPLIGLHKTIVINSLIYVIVSCGAFFLFNSGAAFFRTWFAAGFAILLWASGCFLGPVKIPRDYLTPHGQLLDYKESLHSIVSIIRNTYAATVMEIDRLWQGSDQKTHQVMAAHIPCMLHSNPQTIAVIGVGVGQTAKRFLLYPVQRLDCIDIEQSVFSFIRQYFSGAWLDDQRVSMIVDDGRDHMTHTLNRYDIISIEIGQIFRPQCAAFYSREFYQSLKQALNPGGLVSQFVPLAFLDHEFFLRTIGTFIEVFPNSTLWFNGNELLLIGTQDTTIMLDTARVLSLLAHKDISEDCSFSLWGGKTNSFSRIETIAASFLCGGKKLYKMTKGQSILTDDRPELEYATARHQQYQISAMTSFMDYIAAQCDPVDSILKNSLPDSILKKIAFTRTYNLRNVKAVCYLQEYVRTGIGDYLKNAFAENPFNLDIIMYTGLYAARRGDIADARQLYYQALRIDSTFSPAYNNLGSLEEQRGNLVEATRLYGKAVQADSLDPEANFNIANMYVKRDEPDSAIFFLKKTLQLKPDNEAAKNILSGLELKRKKK